MDFATAIIIVSVPWIASEVFLSRFRRARISDSQFDESSTRIIWITIAISVNIGVFFGFQHLGHFAAGEFVLHVGGLVLIVCGLVVRWVAILTLKSQFTVDVAITEHHRLVTQGIYRYLRHPSYSGSLLSFLGLGLAFANYVSLLAIFIPICAAFLHRIKIEERVLTDNFGTEYRNYCSSTKRLIPFVF
jgi:protein-S-isoprenylcysteine O-methyltransferase Ste14